MLAAALVAAGWMLVTFLTPLISHCTLPLNCNVPHVGKQEEASQLVELLRVTGDLEEQGDILHYMTEQYGLSFKVCISPAASDGRPGGTGRHPPLYDGAVRPLIQGMYITCCE